MELAARPGLRWVDVVAPDEALLNELKPIFGLHRLAMEDCLHLDQRPKLEEFKGHLFLVLHGFEAKRGSAELELEMQELHLFLGSDWVMTVHDGQMGAVKALRARLLKDPAEVLGRGADHLAYLLADAMVDADFPLVERINETIDRLEDQLFSGFKQGQQLQLFAVKRQLVTLRRILSPQRDVIALLSRPGMPHVQERTTFYFRDVHDHLIRLHEQIDAGRDILGNVLDAYLSMVALRTGDISKQLTVIATVFLPLTFLTGFFGMNFDVLSKREYLYFVVACAVALPISMVVFFRRKGWF
ncbi:MAG: magnesium/cobalt transporter CorA [Pseudomonadota bacterium]